MAAKSATSPKSGGGSRVARDARRRATGTGDGGADEVYRSLVDNLQEIIYRKDPSGRFVFVNRRFCEWVGRPREEILGRSEADLFAAPLADRMAADDRELLATGVDGAVVYDFPGCSPARARVTRVAVRDGRGMIVGLHGIVAEVPDGERQRMEEEVYFLSALLESVPDSVYFKDASSRFRRISRYMADRIGVGDPARAVGLTDFDFFGEEHARRAFEDEQQILRTGNPLVNVEEKEVFPDGRVKWVSTTKVPLRDRQGRVVGTFGISRDITEHKRMQAELARHAMYDALTGLPNRGLYLNRLEHLFRRALRAGDRQFLFAVLYLDIDRFKGVNESLGHQAGDELLVQVARRLEGCLRPSDTLARLGGDDFAILLEDLRSGGDATCVAERIHQQLVAPFAVQQTEVYCGASIGIALSTSRYERAEDMLRDADTAMYRAKANGRSRHEIFDADMHRRAVSQLRTETDLRRAIERRELVAFYQPIVDLRTRLLTGFEALVRWRHPQRGLVPPGDFIPIAEETGLIGAIGTYVMREACRQMRAWQTRFPEHRSLRVAVNVSGQQLAESQVVQQIREALADTGLDARSLAVEVTESALVRDIASGAEVMQRLRQLAIQLSIDDFGTGYSSLSYLQNLPVDTLKIDRSFVSRMRRDGGNAEIINAIITLAHSLGMKVIAEGVETREQLEALVKLGCNGAQGFLFARPLPAEDAERLIATGLPASS